LFQPDPEIFKEIKFDWGTVVNRLRGQAYLVKGMRVRVIDARDHKGKMDLDKIFYFSELQIETPSMSFYFEGGLLSLVKFHNQQYKPVHKNIFYIEKENDGISVEVSLQYVDDISSRIYAYANNIPNPFGGTHVTGFKTGARII
jgi:DNA gyrase subunit B